VAIEHIKDMDNNNISQFIQNLSWSHLRHVSRASLEPFQLALAESDDVLFCNEIVRVIPGKRIVAFGTWGGKPVVAKLFYQPRQAQRHLKRECAGIDALVEGGVLTPALYYRGTSKDRRIQVLIFERIVKALSVDSLWQSRASIKEMLPLMHAMTIEIATHHVLGILQNDLHFKNFLVHKRGIFTIDGGDLEVSNQPLTKKDSLDNLGLFFSQLGIGTEELQKTLFQIYTRSRGWIVNKHDVNNLNAAVQRWTAKRWEQYSKKIMRNCSSFVRNETLNNLTVYDRDYESTEFLRFLKNPEVFFASSDTELLKAGGSSTVAKIKIDDRYYVMKRYNIKDSSHWLRRCMRPTRAATGWRLAQRLRLMGLSTAKPVAFIERQFLGLRGKSYLLTEYSDSENAGDFFANHVDDKAISQFVAQQMMALFEGLARLRITHGDLKMTNILICKYKPMLIDLDGMREHRNMLGFKRAFQQEIKRFMFNWRDNRTVYNMFELLVQEVYRRLDV
jgi:tRNA A-37 threonylcarbamoyl transferase component Bud32